MVEMSIRAGMASPIGERGLWTLESLRLLVDSAPEAWVSIDGDGMVVGWNRQAEVMFGRARRRSVGRCRG